MSVNQIVVTRKADDKDLDDIQLLIRDSFFAMLEFTGEEWRERFDQTVKQQISSELVSPSFERIYFSSNNNHFWVAESIIDRRILGCVGLKRIIYEEAELVRMAVSEKLRGGGIGGKLISSLIAFCKDKKISRIVLTTANPHSAKFYMKNNFNVVSINKMPLTPTTDIEIYKMVNYLRETEVRNIAVVGGTHGNER